MCFLIGLHKEPLRWAEKITGPDENDPDACKGKFEALIVCRKAFDWVAIVGKVVRASR